MTKKFKKRPKKDDSKKDLINEQLTAVALWEYIKENDQYELIEILEAYFSAKNDQS